MLRLSIATGESGRIASVIFVFVWFGLLAWTLTSCAFTKSEVTELLSLTPEYQCLKKERGRNPYVSWDGRRYLKPHYGNGTATGGGAVFATLREQKNTSCIAAGEAVTFVTLPLTASSERSLVAFPGRTVLTEDRGQDMWIDVVSSDGRIRYRNDGSGYRMIRE